ncbi:phage tail protein [uncultured Psychrobacter sp.]|uniref:phage tail fiber protein n=1 Tax=uncultured Psychrobacter sp. TaxID=259303 RepID=UPI0025933C1D|nr:phage tail protein [uncultured Psychrobacter sp.]
MAIQLPNPGLGDGQTGDNEFVMWTKVKDNFSNTTHAASRLVGTGSGNVMEVGAFGLGIAPATVDLRIKPTETKFFTNFEAVTGGTSYGSVGVVVARGNNVHSPVAIFHLSNAPTHGLFHGWWDSSSGNGDIPFKKAKIYSESNTTRDANGFIKAASPVVDLYDDHIELNHDAEKQGGINYKKVGTGNYLVKGSLGFAQEGWYIETPKDANGNVLVAVVYEQLDNNDISIKTYDYMLNKKGRIVADTETPLDIPEGRCINLRLHEVEEQLDEPIE